MNSIMKVVYYSYPFFADCDFPLVKALQNKGVDVYYYMPIPRNFLRSSILEFKKPQKKLGLIKASQIEEMQVYKDCLDLNRLFFISGYRTYKYWIPSWILWIYALWHIKRLKADIIHIDWQFNNNLFEKFLFKFNLGKKRIMTVHDPIMHSGQPNALIEEKKRILSFKWAEHLILLNKVQTDAFANLYKISKTCISYSRLGIYNSIKNIEPVKLGVAKGYILFFGSIIPYKGLEYLLEAMVKVHERCPNLKLIIAGGGELYFDISSYKELDYIEWRHRYIGITELAGLLEQTMFVVCPYKDATQSGVIQTAFSMGVPVVATNVGALKDSVIDGETGKLVPPCDVEALADAIFSLFNDKELQKRMRSCIRELAGDDGGWNTIAEDYIHIYSDVLS